ncbi:MAG TPA: dienelactone hydrolase family protein [Solirubrobacteraceae bacterium]|jgi:carboxymethylenebutenolidase|nr:dienelactone hydrolase family protein [Solirubrobacteraceae bacterium]
MTTRSEQVSTADGDFAAHVAIPDSGGGPGILLLQEIFGVNEYIRDAARRLAELGYVVLAPDLFWRIEPGIELGAGDEDLRRGMATVQQLDFAVAVQDAIAALAVLRGLPEVAGDAGSGGGARAGALGFCLGGTLAFQVAAHGDPDVAVCYYGSGIAGALDAADTISCPVLLHFGGSDPHIPREQVDAVAAMAAGHDGFELQVQEDAGHAFDNGFSPRFSDPAAAAVAWEQTSAFLARELPVQ